MIKRTLNRTLSRINLRKPQLGKGLFPARTRKLQKKLPKKSIIFEKKIEIENKFIDSLKNMKLLIGTGGHQRLVEETKTINILLESRMIDNLAVDFNKIEKELLKIMRLYVKAGQWANEPMNIYSKRIKNENLLAEALTGLSIIAEHPNAEIADIGKIYMEILKKSVGDNLNGNK